MCNYSKILHNFVHIYIDYFIFLKSSYKNCYIDCRSKLNAIKKQRDLMVLIGSVREISTIFIYCSSCVWRNSNKYKVTKQFWTHFFWLVYQKWTRYLSLMVRVKFCFLMNNMTWLNFLQWKWPCVIPIWNMR